MATLRFLADENAHGAILSGLRRRLPAIDVVRVHDTEIAGADDAALLAWAAAHDRIVLTHDIRTLLPDAYRRLHLGEHFPGVFAVAQDASIDGVIDDLALIVGCSVPDGWRDVITCLPLG
jgi:hypothetical protein